MRKLSLLLLLALVGLAVMTLPVSAGNSTLTYTAAQSTQIQNRLIPKYNAEHCAQFALPSTCTSSDLTTAGCVARTVRTLVLDSCTIFTSNAAGEQAFLQETANNGLIYVFNRLIRNENDSYNAAECARWRALSGPQQQTECTLRGLSSTCEGPCP